MNKLVVALALAAGAAFATDSTTVATAPIAKPDSVVKHKHVKPDSARIAEFLARDSAKIKALPDSVRSLIAAHKEEIEARKAEFHKLDSAGLAAKLDSLKAKHEARRAAKLDSLPPEVREKVKAHAAAVDARRAEVKARIEAKRTEIKARIEARKTAKAAPAAEAATTAE